MLEFSTVPGSGSVLLSRGAGPLPNAKQRHLRRVECDVVIVEPYARFAELLTKNTIFFPQVLNHFKLALIHPRGYSDQYKPERIKASWHISAIIRSLKTAILPMRSGLSFRAIRDAD